MLTRYRIFENQHLLDATEIFRKLNVHKKVSFCVKLLVRLRQLTPASGILHQARFPSRHVLLLPLQHDCRPHPRRVALNCCNQTTPINSLPTSNALLQRHGPPDSHSCTGTRLSSLAGWYKMKTRDVHVIKQRTYGSLSFLHLTLTKHELEDQGPRMMFLLGLLLSCPGSAEEDTCDAGRLLAHCFQVALYLSCHDAKIPPIRSYRLNSLHAFFQEHRLTRLHKVIPLLIKMVV